MSKPPTTEHDAYDAEYEKGAKAIRQSRLENVTYSHRIGFCIDLKNNKVKRRFFDMFTNNGKPVYIIGITDNAGDFDDYSKAAYVWLRSEQKEAMLGQWTDPRGIRYRDVLLVISGISRNLALKYKRRYSQMSIMEVLGNGPARLI